MEETRVCDICGREHPLSELKEFGGVLLCESCWNSETIVCSQCGKRIWLDNNESDGDTLPSSRASTRGADPLYTRILKRPPHYGGRGKSPPPRP